jgi:hypothetical protein
MLKVVAKITEQNLPGEGWSCHYHCVHKRDLNCPIAIHINNTDASNPVKFNGIRSEPFNVAREICRGGKKI